jgi:hypothetical protein
MMGPWFVATALGNLFAGLTAGTLENKSAGDVFNSVALYIGAAGLVAVAGALRKARDGQDRVREPRRLPATTETGPHVRGEVTPR